VTAVRLKVIPGATGFGDARSLRSFMIGFVVVLYGELEKLARGDDLRLGRLQDRILVVCLPGRKEWCVGIVADRILARAKEQRAFLYFGASCLTAWDQIGNPRSWLGVYPA